MFRRLLRPLLACALLPLVAVVGTASPAVAASCATAGHAYVIQGGGVYMSGYEGNYQNGVQYLVLTAGTPFQVGANGVKPDNFVTFELVYGETTSPFWQPASQKLIRLQAGGNCVFNQKWVTPNVNPSEGTYSVRVSYVGGNSGTVINETIVYIIFIPPLPDDGGGGGGGGGGGCDPLLPCPV